MADPLQTTIVIDPGNNERRAESRQLFRLLREEPHDRLVRNRIVELNLDLVRYWLNRIINEGNYLGTLEMNDLFQEGAIGLIEAIGKFDCTAGYEFSTYASWWIRNAIKTAIRRKSTQLNFSAYIRRRVSQFLEVRKELSLKLGRQPYAEEIAKEMSYNASRVKVLFQIASLMNMLSLDSDGSGKRTLHEELSQGDVVINQVLSMSREKDVDRALALLKERGCRDAPRKRRIVELRVGLEGDRAHSFEEIGKILGIKKQSAQTSFKRSMKAMRDTPRIIELLGDYV